MKFKFMILIILFSCNYMPPFLHDNPIEESIECEIEDKTGVKIDFTGNSPEGQSVPLKEF